MKSMQKTYNIRNGTCEILNLAQGQSLKRSSAVTNAITSFDQAFLTIG